MVDFEGLCSADMYPIGTGLSTNYLHRWLVCPQFTAMASQNQGRTVLPKINKAALMRLPVPVPPENEQRRIAAKIEALFARSGRARESLEAIPPLLDKLRQSILAAAFRGDLTADWRAQHPDVEPASALLERIRTERRRRWEQAELAKLRAKGKDPKNDKWKAKYKEPEHPAFDEFPQLPPGWAWTTLDAISMDGPSNGFSPVCGEQGTGPSVLSLGATTSGSVVLNEKTLKRALEPIPPGARGWLSDGDLLVQRGNTLEYVGTAALYKGPSSKYIYPDLMIRLQFSSELPALTAWHYINSPAGKRYLRERATGTAGNMPKINGATLSAMPLPFAPESEQTAIHKLIKRALDAISRIGKTHVEGEKCCALVDQSILAKAFRGELVEQDPDDEPASVLLERIRAARTSARARTSAKPAKKPARSRRTKK